VPDVHLIDSSGSSVNLRAPGHPTVLFFYPKANSKYCTDEMRHIAELSEEFRSHKALVYGISRDSEDVQKQFKEEFELPFPMISDEDGEISKAFGARMLWGLLPISKRVTYVIDSGGIVRFYYRNEVNAVSHGDKALAALESAK